ncbi:arsenosugar biosynthesis radical SAM (seleno)protein ArsS [Thermodesulfobacteriota bacterium]
MDPAQLSQEIQAVNEGAVMAEPFHQTLSSHELRLVRADTATLQLNTGLLCNQTCRHCHLDAGPGRKENMDLATAKEVVSYAARAHFETVDITGGAPELNPHLPYLIEQVSGLTDRVMLRSNLSALSPRSDLIELLKTCRVVIVASLPSLNESQADSQRGSGIFQASIETLRKLNALGYGQEETGLELNLVSNPTGAFLPSSQAQTEKRFRQMLDKKWGLRFNNLFNFANAPLGRFRQWLLQSGNLQKYIEKLVSSFNPCAVESLMCRSLISISWDGYLYDCDFNLARGIYMGGHKTHISEMSGPPSPGTPIAVADHCYTCTAGAGFT